MTKPKIVVNRYSIILLFAYLFLIEICHGQQTSLPAVESFESKDILNKYCKSANAELSVTSNHHRFGTSALEWKWNGTQNSFGTSNFRILGKSESPLAYGDHFPSSPTLIFSIYNIVPQEEKIRISFDKNEKKEVWFDLDLTFRGWRHFWVPFYEMSGNAKKKGEPIDYDYFEVSSTAKKGSLFFDDIIFSQYQDDRHQYPDLLVPFIKKEQAATKDHWMPMINNLKRLQTLKTHPISETIKVDLQKIEKRLNKELTNSKDDKTLLKDIEQHYQKLHLEEKEKTVMGPPLTFRQQQEYFNTAQQGSKEFNDIKDLGIILQKLAKSYDTADPSAQKEIKRLFLIATKYFLDQGWQSGSSGGTRHHVGYALGELTISFYLMRKTLQKEGLLNQAGASLQWLYNLGMILGDEKDFHVNIDYLNTQAYYHLLLIFLTESQEKQAALLKAYSNYMTLIMAQENEEWGFKPDGTSWHHNGHYPAYGLGAFKKVPKVIHTLSGTSFRIGEQGHKNFKKAFLTTSIYCETKDWGFGNAGRHPFEGNNINSLQKQYLQMAHSGNPEGNLKIDKDVAAAYLRIWGDEDATNSAIFTDINKIEKEPLTGYFTLPYAATAIQRRDDWAAIIKGYSKYVWASEIYVASNRYGRYPANGTIQLLNKQGEKASGFKQEGWDWNRFPGATIIYLPYEELETEMPLLMFRSDETFAGAVKLDKNGLFGMILNESKESYTDGPESRVGFPGKLKAKKSIFSYGDKLICIGTNISSVNEINPVQTNLFQLALKENKMPLYSSSFGKIIDFPYDASLQKEDKKAMWLIDPYRNGYHILSDTPVALQKKEQHSYHNKYSLRTGAMNPKGKGAKKTKGKFTSAWLNHGTKPKNASYQYVIYPDIPEKDLLEFGNKVKNDDSYSILRADSVVHIVLDKETSTTGYVIYEANKSMVFGPLKTVSEPALVMVREDTYNTMTIGAVQPDLNFPEYKKGEFRNYSRHVQLKITVKGKWKTPISGFITAIDIIGEYTTVTIMCIDGLPREFKLTKV